ncbi:unnamed protein product [Brachionus calyciflorus]|uniref:Uncharacterized protein n=1 Tax=Brachionus calyciflorus TaxID=104777 RepID=A0A814REC0_9BILA|nr:unnamed protein product [Brachionus calyciflorus]
MNILNEAVDQLMSEFPQIFEQNDNENIPDLHDNNVNFNLNSFPQTSIQIGGNLNHYITQTKSTHNHKFNCTLVTYKIGFSQNLSSFGAAIEDIKLAFENLTNQFISQMGTHDKIRIVLYHDSLERPISIPFLKKTDLTSQVLLDSFERVIQSHKEVQINENNNLTAHVIIARLPSGSGRKMVNLKKRKTPYTKTKDCVRVQSDTTNEFQKFCENKRFIIPVFNNDKLCALRAIIIGKAYADNHEIKSELAKPNSKILEQYVTKVVKKLYLPNAPCRIPEIKRIETFLCDYQITIINCDGKIDKKPIYIGPKNKNTFICVILVHIIM